MSVKRYRKQPVDIDAMQWDGTDERADEIYEWTGRKCENFGTPVIATMFMVLGEDDAYEVFRCYDEDYEVIPGNAIDRLIDDGFTATLRVEKSDQWANLRTGDWVIRESDGIGFYPCAADVFAATYAEVD